jgi:hypothetical protein
LHLRQKNPVPDNGGLSGEAGVMPVASGFRRQAAQGRVLNYAASTNWAFARIGAMPGSNEESSLEAFGRAMRDRRWVENVASEAEVAGVLDCLTQGLNEGGIGIGILNAYAPGAGVQELTAVCQLAAAHACRPSPTSPTCRASTRKVPPRRISA